MLDKKLFIYAFVMINLFSLVNVSFASSIDLSESLYPQVSRNVIRLECRQEYRNEGFDNVSSRNLPVGTAFFVGLENPPSTDNMLFVVTARHVAEEPCDLHARVQTKNLKTGKNEIILLKLNRNRWIFHPSSGDNTTNSVDVAAMRIQIPPDRNILCFIYNPNNRAVSNLLHINPNPPLPVIVFGFPGDIGFELKEQRPFGRFGIISMVTGEKFIKIGDKFAEEKAYIIDSNIFPGNSGSPVINQLVPIGSDKVVLLGLVSAADSNMKYAIVEPASRIIETIEKTKNQSIGEIGNWFYLE